MCYLQDEAGSRLLAVTMVDRRQWRTLVFDTLVRCNVTLVSGYCMSVRLKHVCFAKLRLNGYKVRFSDFW